MAASRRPIDLGASKRRGLSRGLVFGCPIGLGLWALIFLAVFFLSGCSAQFQVSSVPISRLEAESSVPSSSERIARLELVRNAQLLLDYQTARCVMRGGTTCGIPRFP